MSKAVTAAVAAGLVSVAAAVLVPVLSRDEERYLRARREMVERQLRRPPNRPPIKDEAVLRAMLQVPRHLFVPRHIRPYAYEDAPKPIGYGQTISQPYIVALMTEHLKPQPTHRVLEVGTGSGYQAAVLAQLVKEVYTVEIIPPLARAAEKRLARLGYRNVTVKVGDGYYGWPEHAPFDGIVVTAAATAIPPPLIEQLKPGGRMVIPVGPPGQVQVLKLLIKNPQGPPTVKTITYVRFVPLRGGH